MAMGKQNDDVQGDLWIATSALPKASGHPFYQKLNAVLKEHGFDAFAEAECAQYYAETMGRPSIPPGMYFRMMFIGYFEGHCFYRSKLGEPADIFFIFGGIVGTCTVD